MSSFQVGIIVAILAAASALPTDHVISKRDPGPRYQYMSGPDGPELVDMWMKTSDVLAAARYSPDDNNAYHLFTRDNSAISQPLPLGYESILKASHFDARKKTVFLIHGWRNTPLSDFNVHLVYAYLTAEDVNLIMVDWSVGAGTSYMIALNNSIRSVGALSTPSSPIPSTSKGVLEEAASADLSVLNLDSEDDDTISQQNIVTRRVSETSRLEESINYQPLKNQASTDATSMSTLNSDPEDHTLMDDGDGASTSCDVLSLQYDETSIAASEDLSVYCGTLKKTKKIRSKEEKQLRDLDMWQASDVEVMQNLLRRSGTLDDQIKWEAIATARGLCTLKDSCTCDDCVRAKYLAGVTDGDGGLGAAPLFNAISVGCIVQ